MESTRWTQISELFNAALEQPQEAQTGFVEAATGADGELRDQVLGMLREDQTDNTGRVGALEQGAVETPPPALALQSREIAGYRLIRLLGAGGMGAVWEAEQASPARRVAFKTLRSGAIAGRAGDRLEREAALLGRLNHPAVAQVYEAGSTEIDGQELPWIAMELVEQARPLLDHARERGLSPSARLELLIEVARAVHHGHERGVVHRDLKAGNVLVDGTGRVKVIDFGIASALEGEPSAERLTRTGDMLGTLRSMAPEQFRSGAEIDARTDVFALGCLLYELLCGVPPLDVSALSFSEAVQRIERDPPRPPREAVESLGPELDWILARALAKRPQDRYPSAAALADDLAQVLVRGPVSVGPPTAMYRARTFLRRYRGPALAVAAVFIALTAGLIATGFALSAEGRARELAESESLRLSQLALLPKLTALEQRAEQLWPAWPKRLPALDAWVSEARQLTARLPELRAGLAELQRPDAPDTGRREALALVLARLEAFSDPNRGLAGDEAVADAGWSVPRRARHARWLAGLFEPGGEADELWRACAEEVAASPRYDGLRIAPQMGLWPLGRDARSGLQEFAHLGTGEVPRQGNDGSLLLDAKSAAVFVLVPGGQYLIGSQSGDPGGLNYDPLPGPIQEPIQTIQLSPYLIGKHELSQEQWFRLTGDNPSAFVRDKIREGPLHPVEMVNWSTATRVLRQHGLDLPSECQWEAAARGGTTTAFWTGPTRETAIGAMNIVDRSTLTQGASFPDLNYWPEFDDGYPVHAPVHTLQPNPFGLHHVIGNVSEWCLDRFGEYYGLPDDIDPVSTATHFQRVTRGGCFSRAAHNGKSALRSSYDPTAAVPSLGVRPARRLQ